MYDISSGNHSEILENTAVHINPVGEVGFGYYCGIYSYLPFFHVLKFYKFEKYPEALEDTLKLINVIFRSGFNGVQE